MQGPDSEPEQDYSMNCFTPKCNICVYRCVAVALLTPRKSIKKNPLFFTV